ncbi:MAG: DinB family protein [Phycisphaerales bacterium]
MSIIAMIDRYAAGAELPARAIAGLSPADLNAFPIPGTWSIQQIIVHLMDSDLIASDRMKRVAAENVPLIVNYDESAFIRNLAPERVDPAMACEVFRMNRLLTTQVLRALPAAAFEKYGVHSLNGKRTLADLVGGYADHLDGHLKHVYEKRRLLGKPL